MLRSYCLIKKLKVGKITYQSSDLPAGQIIDQYPKKDKSAKENTAIDIFVAKKKTENTKAFEDVGDSEVKEPKENGNKNKEEDKKEKTKPADDKQKEKTPDKVKEKTPEQIKEKTLIKPRRKQLIKLKKRHQTKLK